ncbi:MAG: glutaminase A [Sphingobacterium sp.]|jgi:glutaminase|nr:glutaminase A [Sphingobacterium sp.]
MNREQALHCIKNVLTTLLIVLTTSSVSFAQKNNTTDINVTTLASILEKNKHYYKEGTVADYIPELGKVDPTAIAFAIVNSNGKLISVGDRNHKFTMQSVSKIIALMLAVMENGEETVFEKIGYYGTDRPFNHFANLETTGKPLNPMMNAGAILTTSMISGKEDEPFVKILEMIRYITNNPSITYSQAVYQSEKETGHRNRGMFYLMKNTGAITGSEDQLDNYFRQCSIELTAEDLAKIGYFFANECSRYDGDKKYKNNALAKLILSQMLVAGMYEFSGEYARTVGLPSKSGVGGGIVVSVPHGMGIGVFSPALDSHGNSLAGYHMILDLAKKYDLSIF